MKLTPNQKRALWRLWMGEYSLEEIPEEMELATASFTDTESCSVREFTLETVVMAARQMGLPERVEPDIYLPTQQEIRMACAVFRAGWTQAEREARMAGSFIDRMKEAPGEHNNACGSALDDRRTGVAADAPQRGRGRR